MASVEINMPPGPEFGAYIRKLLSMRTSSLTSAADTAYRCAGERLSDHCHHTPAVSWWQTPQGDYMYLCQGCLDWLFDLVDDQPEKEPAGWGWLPGRREGETS